ncbi:dihydropyrimidinase [Pikeienuella piscinae]|uniref:D-hydantoinase n=1 Tax=Pikeienuella piscinae TaxID=2748098 RepID=A0A7L5BYC5_9RHOB|nr:dihydropyrimidinase [Pikeienuella piscinae]QIE56752.1 dihydropyrimidinase [Pikeienuella piscinae]
MAEDFDLLIRNGDVFTGGALCRCDVGVRNGVIAAIADRLDAPAARTVDAAGKLVLPGGVDSHVHIDQPSGSAAEMCDDFDSASASAAAGGTTTVISFAWQSPGESLAGIAEDYARRARKSRVDYTFHLTITDPTEKVLEDELPALVAAGDRSIKIFMTYKGVGLKDKDILRVLDAARRNRALVCVHAENHALIEYLTEKLVSAGLGAPKYFPLSKPMTAEREAVNRIIAFSEALDTPIHIFHVSGAESAAEIERAQQRGLKVTAETCPHYLTITADDLDKPGFEGAKLIFGPPARTVADQDALWNYIRRGVISVISSDHSPSRYDDVKGKKVAGEDAPFSVVPNGVPGLAARMPVLFSEGVSKGRITIAKFVDLVSAEPARRFGIFPQKGLVAVGSDADFVIWDPERKVVIRNEMMRHAGDYTPWEGFEVTGWPSATYVRGRLVCKDGAPVAEAGGGRHVPRAPYPLIEPAGRARAELRDALGA